MKLYICSENVFKFLQLIRKIEPIKNVIPVANLPTRDIIYNKRAEIAGWGKDSSGKSPPMLKKLSGIIITKESCAQNYGLRNILRRDDCMCVHTNDNIGFGANEVSPKLCTYYV